jgi:2,4-didehydro-3-deoxy-L-rhamnonate hydrolase
MQLAGGQWALGTVAERGRAFPALLLPGERVVDLTAAGFRTAEEIVAAWGRSLPDLERAAAAPRTTIPLADVEVRIPYRPTQVLQSGANYRTHVIDLAVDREIGRRPGMSIEDLRAEATEMMDARIASGEPYVFLGALSACSGPYDDVILPSEGEHDWELELAAVIGRSGRHIPEGEALAFVAGYTICNDLTTRDLVHRADMPPIGTDWLRGKNAPTFLPVGPWIVPARFAGDPGDLRIVLKLNGEAMQDASTADMMFGVARLVAYVSHWVGVRAGDLLLTGSPAGNGTHYGRYLRPGDVLEGSISGLGTQRQTCVAEAA